MKIINVYEAKMHLSKLLEAIQDGEDIIIAKAGKPMATLAKYTPAKPQRSFGAYAKQFSFKDDDLMGPDQDVAGLFYGGM